MMDTYFKELKRKMDLGLKAFQDELAGLRTGRASSHLLEHIKVDMYGSFMPISQVGTVSVPEPRLITVSVWDKEAVKSVEKAIRESDLGLNPIAEGQVIRVSLPDLTEERRKDLIKIAHKYAEQGRIAIRNIRREGMDIIKKMQKSKEISEDDSHKFSEDIQKTTDEYIKKVDQLLSTKEKEIIQV
jgi:ribosome recycling factor